MRCCYYFLRAIYPNRRLVFNYVITHAIGKMFISGYLFILFHSHSTFLLSIGCYWDVGWECYVLHGIDIWWNYNATITHFQNGNYIRCLTRMYTVHATIESSTQMISRQNYRCCQQTSTYKRKLGLNFNKKYCFKQCQSVSWTN